MTAENRKIVLGTRGSELARTQARLVEKAIQTVWPEAKIETRVIDPRAGRKGVFTAEIERALLAEKWMLRCIVPRTCRVKRARTQKSQQFFPGHRWTTCWFPNTGAVLLPFLRAPQWQPAACEENISCSGNVRTSTLSIFAATCRRGCENWRKTSGTPSC